MLERVLDSTAQQPSRLERRRALFVPDGIEPLAAATRLLDFAEQSFPALFPGSKPNRPLTGFVYRYYPETGIYLAVISWRVYAMGGPLGSDIRDFGELTDFVGYPANNRPPTVTLTAPTAGTNVTAPAAVTLSAQAGDADGRVTKVEFFVQGLKVGEDTSAPYTVSWNAAAAGSYAVRAVATDDRGATGSTADVAVTILPNNAPTVAISSPRSGTTIPGGSSVVVQASASDSGGTVAKVEFFDGATKIGEATATPYSITWSPTPGPHSLTAKATDNAGLSVTSATINISVGSPAGTITAATLAKCPTASGTNVQNSFTCFVGTSLTGHETFDATKPCTLSVAANGIITLTTDSVVYTIDSQPINTYRYYYKSDYHVTLDVGLLSSTQPYSIEIETKTRTGEIEFFKNGGLLLIEAMRRSPGAVANCTIPVPAF